MSDTYTDGGERSKCPICGQPYEHKRSETKGTNGPQYRRDAKICKTVYTGQTRTVFVHIPDSVGTGGDPS